MKKLAILVSVCALFAGVAVAQTPAASTAPKAPVVQSVPAPSSSPALAKPLSVNPPPKPNKWATIKELFL